MALQTSVKGRAGQMRNRGLQGIKVVVERQQSMPSKGNDDGLFPPDRTVDLGSFGPVGRSETEVRAFHLAIVFGLTP